MVEKMNIQKIVEVIVEKTKKQYSKYNEYLPKNFYDELQRKLPSYYSSDMTVSPDVELKITASNLLLKELSKQVRNGNFEVEIELVNDYKGILRWIMIKKNIADEIYLKKGEDILMKAIETYEGNKTFLVHLYNCVKVDCKNDIKENPIDKKIIRYIEKEEDYAEPNYLDLVGKELDIINYISKNDNMLYQFIYLKYGYKFNRYFTLIDIAEILNISMDKVKKYYKDSLTVLKDVVDLYLEDKSDERIEYAQKLLKK